MLTARPVKTIVSFLLIFALSLFASGCGSANREAVVRESVAQNTDKKTEEKSKISANNSTESENFPQKPSANQPDEHKQTIFSARYDFPQSLLPLDDTKLLNSLQMQTFELNCPLSEQPEETETVFVKLKLPKGWTQDSKNPTLFFFPDDTKAMQIEILPLENGQCIWSAERLWEDKSCINYSEKYIHYSWNTSPRYTFYSVHPLDQSNRYDYTYYLPYGSYYFAIHFDTVGEDNKTALRFQKAFLETIQLLTPIPSDQPALPSEETWKATVSLTTEEQTTELTLDVPVVWAQEKPGASVFCDSDSVGCISSMSLIKLSPGQTVWDIADEEEHLLQRTAVINGQEIPRLVFTPPYKPGEDSSKEFGVRRYYYYLPMEEHCLVIPFFARGIDNEHYIRLHRKIMESIRFVKSYPSDNPAEYPELPNQASTSTGKEKEILSTQAELLTKQIVSSFYPKLSPQLSEQSAWKADNEIIERFWLTIGIYDKEPNYPYPDTYQTSSDGVLRFPEETVQTITKEVFGQDISPELIEYNDKEQVYYYTIGFGVSAYGFEKMTTTFQNNNSEILVSYELWSDPNFPMYQKIDDYQSLFAVKQREDGSYYLQYVKTEKQ